VSGVPLQAQNALQCGDIIENEFTRNREVQQFKIELAAGDKLKIEGKPIGDTLAFMIAIFGPSGLPIAANDNFFGRVSIMRQPVAETSTLSATGTYTVIAVNNDATLYDSGPDKTFTEWSRKGGVGAYSLLVSCVKRDGTRINAGQVAQPTQQPANTSNTSAANSGLPLVAATGAVSLPLALGQPTTVAVESSITYAIMLPAQPGDKYEIAITRQGGMVPLALTVYDPSKAVIFALAMGNSATFTTEIEISATGEHTLAFGLAALGGSADNAAGVYQVTVTKL
jgi:hypothetical protein